MANAKKSFLRDYLYKGMDYHCAPIKELEQRLQTDMLNGLSLERAREVLARDGHNTLEPRQFSFSRLSIRGMFSPFTLTMAAAGILCFVIYGLHLHTKSIVKLDFIYYGFILLLVSLINGCTYTFQLRQEAKTLDSFQFMWPRKALVIRGGRRKVIPVSKVVKGDIVELLPGRRIPADVRIFVANNLKVDDSVITQLEGAQQKSTICTNPVPLRSQNMAYFGSQCEEGYGKAMVVATGNRTVIGKIARLMSALDDHTKPQLAYEISDFEVNVFVVLLIGTSIFSAFFFFQFTLIDYFIFWVAMIVGNIPEALVPTIGLVLIVMAKRLAKMKLIVKHLMAIDTLGLTSALCIGKTGTLTKNEKVVAHVWIDNKIYSVENSTEEKGLDNYMFSESWFEFSRGAMLSNTVNYTTKYKDANDIKKVEESSDYAILDFTEQKVGNVSNYQVIHSKVFETHFSPTNGYSMTVYKMKRPDGLLEYVMFIKGAPDVLFKKCSTILIDGVTEDMDDDIEQSFWSGLDNLAKLGETPIGLFDVSFSQSTFSPNRPFKCSGVEVPDSGLRFLGMVSLADPANHDVAEHILKCRKAGIKIILATGAHPITTKTIAEEIGIATTVEEISQVDDIRKLSISTKTNEQHAVMMTGLTFQCLEAKDLNTLLSVHDILIFARMTPHQKFLIVDTLQKEGFVVTLTGETTMDIVSIKKADTGIAMGTSSSDALNEAADVILLDRNFQNVVEGIEVGRLFFTNLKKILVFSLSQHLPESIPYFLNIMWEYPMPLLSKSFLCLNIGIDILPAVSLGFEKAEDDLMLRKPLGQARTSLLSCSLIFQTYFLFGVYETAAAYLANFMVIAEDGFLGDKIWGIKTAWDSMAINDLEDSYGQEWTFKARKDLGDKGQTAFFITVVVMQLINAVICKTSRISIFRHGMRNWYLNGSLVFSVLLALAVVHVPFISNFIHTWPLRIHIWLIGVPFGVMLFLSHEVCLHYRRQLGPGSWFEKEIFN